MKTVLTIAGSDTSGGAGIQGDLKAIKANGAYGLSCITAITAQNTQRVCDVFPLSAPIIQAQLSSLFDDFSIDAIKIGMLATDTIVHAVVDRLRHYHGAIVVDPVLISSSGTPLLSPTGIETVIKQLLPFATLITPNLTEAEFLMGTPLTHSASIQHACKQLANQFNTSVLIKGGHRSDEDTVSTDTLYAHGSITTYQHARLQDANVHGTGCAYASAIASHLAQARPISEAIDLSHHYLYYAIRSSVSLGHGASLMI
jgi:hydroxymethylpyrimidine/phosphomethylpyrimidine kinase